MDKKTLEALARRAGCFPVIETEQDLNLCCPIEGGKALDAKALLLIAVGAAVAACCAPYFEYHVKAAREAGISQAELAAAVDVGKKVRRAIGGFMEQKCLQLDV
jgi:AhpD family alkylhydroperoxidase